jgi:HSP20 family protein
VAFARWDPLQDLLVLHERMNRLAGLDAPGWVPLVDVYETGDRIFVAAELPGLTRDDVQIQVHEGKLNIRGQRPPRGVTCEQYHRVERGHGQFSRTFQLPAAIEPEGIMADLKNGLLTVTIPKSGASNRRIDVQ